MARRARSGKDRAIISHGITVRVPRGLLADGRAFEGVTLVDDAPQGTVFRVEDGVATALHVGAGVSGGGIARAGERRAMALLSVRRSTAATTSCKANVNRPSALRGAF